ncbi:MAG: iron complex outermembrane receptor protein [Psychromonas sp.]|jgi:iron complex outermembrane receptor protein|uniref:TonB-dependent siderophore receptor n=1 Tax=Psychromonas sp. TaxID=1884585 RepID=UPI0039E4050B
MSTTAHHLISAELKHCSYLPKMAFCIPFSLSLIALAMPSFTFAEEAADTKKIDTLIVTASALKLATPLPESTRSVSVIDTQQLEIQQPSKLDEAVRYQAGVVSQPYGSDNDNDWFKIRGFNAATYLDGNRLYNTGYYNWIVEPYGLERIEILKGPAAILYGEAPAGGVVNALSKKPNYNESGNIQLQVGTRGLKQLGIDVNRLVDDEGDIRLRFVGTMSERDGMLNDSYNQGYYLAPSLAIDLNSDTKFTILASVKRSDGVPTNGFFPAYGTLIETAEGQIDPSSNLGEPDYDTNESDQYSIAYELDHYFDDTWTFKQKARYAQTDLLLRSTYVFPNSTSADLFRGLVYRDGTTKSFTLDNQVIAEWRAARSENTLLIGVELQRFNNKSKELDDYGTLTGGISAFNPVYGNYTAVDSSILPSVEINKSQLGLYAQQQVKLDDKWIMKLGGRYDWVDLENENKPVTGSSTQEKSNESHFSLNAGVMYLSDNGLSPYASYSESFEMIASIDPATGSTYKPLVGKQTEIGVKYEPSFVNGYINLALFSISQNNALVTNPANYVQTQTGKLTSQGLELDLLTNLTQALLLRANYTFTDARTDETYGNGTKQQAGIIPRHMASSWLEFDFTDNGIPGFIVGAGARFNGESVDNPASSDLKVPSYTLFDAMARYDINKQWRAQVNVTNLTDKEFIASCDYYCYYGEGMSAVATINYTW